MSEETKRITVDGHQQQMKKRYKRHIEKRIWKEETFAIVVRGEIGNGYIHTRWDFDMGITFSESSISLSSSHTFRMIDVYVNGSVLMEI